MNASESAQIPLLELDLLKTLVAIAETGNFSKAAETTFRTPSAVSMQVKRMEETLGRSIFRRDSRSVSLTDDGERLLAHARRVLALNRDIVSQFVSPDVSGIVRLGAPDDVAERFLPEMLCRFSECHPAVTVDVVVENSPVLAERVRKQQLEIAIVTCGDNPKNPIQAEVVFRERLCWAGVRGGIAAEQNPLPITVWDEDCIWRKAAIGSLEKQNRDFRIAFRSAHISGQKAAVFADLAIAALPVSSCEGRIISLDSKYDLPELPEYALGILVNDNATPQVISAADHIRASFAKKQ